MFCHQYPTKTCGQGNLAVGSSWDHVASLTRWCATQESWGTPASPQAVGREGGMTWRTEVHD
jgi:hypothetical protein